MRCLFVFLAGGILAADAAAQLPRRLEAVELARSRSCVGVLDRLDALDRSLAPLVARSERLLAIAQAVALEDPEAVEPLDARDPLEGAVSAWFASDSDLARRYLAAPAPALLEERMAAREAIKARVNEALAAVQREANEAIEATGDLRREAARCDGAVFIRGAVVETCGRATSPVCIAAADSIARSGPFRFVESADVLWGLQELRAWTAPTPFRVADGQLTGARTVGVTRVGNVVVTVVFGPLLQQRSALAPEALQTLLALADSLGYGTAHPDLVYVPSLAVHATLPEPLDEEAKYVLHFGLPEEADAVWIAEAGTGEAIEGIVPLGPGYLDRLRAGDPLQLTAVRAPDERGESDALYAIELSALNQASSVQALLGYMAGPLAADLLRFLPPQSGRSEPPQAPPSAPAGRTPSRPPSPPGR